MFHEAFVFIESFIEHFGLLTALRYSLKYAAEYIYIVAISTAFRRKRLENISLSS